MTKQSRALTRQMERAIETALMPGRFVLDRASFAFVRGLEAIETDVAAQLSTDPAHAVALYETFLAGCYEKAEEIDDSIGTFGDFVGRLHCAWIEASQAAGADADEIATRVLAWMEADGGRSLRPLPRVGTRRGKSAQERSSPARVRAEGRRSCSERKHAGRDSAVNGTATIAPRRGPEACGS